LQFPRYSLHNIVMTQNNINPLVKKVGDALSQRDRIGFRDAVVALIDARYPLKSGWKSLSQPLMDFGELDLARQSMQLYVDAMDRDPAARFSQAVILAQTGKADQARMVLQGISHDVPDRANNAFLKGTIALNMGDIAAAQDSLVEASKSYPDSGQIVLALSETGPMSADTRLADLVLSMQSRMKNAPDAERACYLYAAGKTLDDLGDYTSAAKAFSEGAELVRIARKYNYEIDQQSAKLSISGFSTEMIEVAGKSVNVDSRRPIMVTGTPRSGTTLVEQILTSHALVSDGDELGRFALVAQDAGGTSASALAKTAQSKGGTTALAKSYLHLVEQRFGSGGRVVDKTLDASRYLGLFAAVLPDAPLIWLRRNASDRAWSCFRTYFSKGVAWSWSLEDIAKHFALEERLLMVWKEILRDRLLIVDYEELVEKPQIVISSIAQHCGLKTEPAMLEPHKTKRMVTTASVMQIRSPIHNDSIGKAGRYESAMGGFQPAYESALKTAANLFP
jgi:tetratricopeptide (TPR) repeat protein